MVSALVVAIQHFILALVPASVGVQSRRLREASVAARHAVQRIQPSSHPAIHRHRLEGATVPSTRADTIPRTTNCLARQRHRKGGQLAPVQRTCSGSHPAGSALSHQWTSPPDIVGTTWDAGDHPWAGATTTVAASSHALRRCVGVVGPESKPNCTVARCRTLKASTCTPAPHAGGPTSTKDTVLVG